MLRKERADWSAGALWCHIQVCETLFYMLQKVASSSQGNVGSRRPYDRMVLTTLIGWDVPRTLTDHWHEIRLHGCISVKDRLLFVPTAHYRPGYRG